MIPKHREPCILFLEDAFAESHAQRLREAGYAEVRRFVSEFHNGETKRAEQGIKDPEIIKLCNKNGWLLVTIDSSMHLTHTELIKTTRVTILATAHNHADNMDEWVDALIQAKPKIERLFKKFPRPWFGTIARNGEIASRTIRADTPCKRNRPKERGVVAESVSDAESV